MDILEIDQSSEWWAKLLEVLPVYQPGANPSWLTVRRKNFISSHNLIVIDNDEIIGFMRYCIRQLPIERNGEILTEATGEALGVKPDRRNQGIGKLLQNTCMNSARLAGCYQFRSFVLPEAEALCHIKIRLGYGVYPSPDGWLHFIKVF